MTFSGTGLFCDKCGQFISGKGVVSVMSPGFFTQKDLDIMYTLCPGCCGEFIRWVKGGSRCIGHEYYL